MKFFTIKGFGNEVVYVQRADISFLTVNTEIVAPATISLKTFYEGNDYVVQNNAFEFVLFENKTEVDFFKGLDFIVDYSTFFNVSKRKFKKIISAHKKSERILRKSYITSKTVEEREDIAQKIKFMRYKISDLYTILQVKRGKLGILIP